MGRVRYVFTYGLQVSRRSPLVVGCLLCTVTVDESGGGSPPIDVLRKTHEGPHFRFNPGGTDVVVGFIKKGRRERDDGVRVKEPIIGCILIGLRSKNKVRDEKPLWV